MLYLAEEEFTFTKYLNFMHNGLKFGKVVINSTKMLAVIVKECNFITASVDEIEAHKTSEGKELVFGKVIIKGCNGVAPCCFLLKMSVTERIWRRYILEKQLSRP